MASELQHLGVPRRPVDEARAGAEENGGRLGICVKLGHQAPERGADGRRIDAACPARVDDDSRRHLGAGPDGLRQQVEAANRLG